MKKLSENAVAKIITRIWISIDQKSFLKCRYYRHFKKFPNLNTPKTFNEKVLWIALYSRNNLYTTCADKVDVKYYLNYKLGKENADKIWTPKYGVWDDVEDIDFDLLPNQFVLKSCHSSGQIISCNDKKQLNIAETKRTMRKWLQDNLYYYSGEWQYKNIKPRIICEKLLEQNIVDYRIFCFNGEPEYIKTTQHNPNTPRGYDYAIYNTEWEKMNIYNSVGYGDKDFDKPKTLYEMLAYARILSNDFSFVRVDFFVAGDEMFFAELTFTPGGGWEDFATEEIAIEYGNKIDISFLDPNIREYVKEEFKYE